MARNLNQFLRAGERVLHHVPEGRLKPNWGTWLTGMAAFGALVLLLFWLTVEPYQFDRLAVLWAIVWAIVTPLSLLEDRTVETAVTEHRVLRLEETRASRYREVKLDQFGAVLAAEGFRFTEVKLEDVAAVMALADCVRITKTDGGIVLLMHQDHAADIAAALGHAAGLPPPHTPLTVRIAQNVVSFGAALGMGAGLGLALRYLPDPDGALEIILRILLGTSAGAIGGIAAGVLVIAALRTVLAKDELRACVQVSLAMLPWVRPDPSSPNRLTRLFLRYVDRLYRRVPAQPN